MQTASVPTENEQRANGNDVRVRPKILFLVGEDRFFWSHRLPVAQAALRNGYEVIVATCVSSHAQQILDEGFRLIPLKLSRKNKSLRGELSSIIELRQVYRKEEPDIVQHVAIKPVLYGSIAAWGRKNMNIINALTGLGYLVVSSSWRAWFFRVLVWRAFRFFLNRPNQRVFVENPDDRQLLIQRVGVSPDKIVLTRGSGVDVTRFVRTAEPGGTPVVLLGSRMLWMKGIKEFVEAAKLLQSRGVNARFVLVGDTDLSNPSYVPRQRLFEWQSSGVVEWWGYQEEMVQVFKQANVVCLPSHGGEGLPKVLMEAASAGRAIVTTDVPGCREIVRHGVNGLIVKSRDAASLAGAIEQLLKNPVMRQQMAVRGREMAVNEFSAAAVVSQTLALYRELLGPCQTSVEAKGRAATQPN